MGDVIQFPLDRARAKAPAAGPLALELRPTEPARTDDALSQAAVDIDHPSEAVFRDALGYLAVARLTSPGPRTVLIESALLERLADEAVPLTRRHAIAEAFATLLGQPEHNDVLLPMLQDDDPDLRRLAATALGSAENHEAVGPLSVALLDRSAPVGVAAASSLAAIGHQDTPRVFAAVLRAFPARAVRLEVLRRLRAFAAEHTEAIVVEHCGHADAEVRLAAALAVEPGRSPAARKAALRLLRDEDVRIRVLAVGMAEQAGDPASLNALLEALGDPDPRVRKVAAESARRVRWRRTAR